MRKSQSESGILPQMYSDSSGNDIGMGTDGKPRRIFQKKDLIEAVRRLSPGRGTPGMKEKMARTSGTRSTRALETGKARLRQTLRALETGVNMHARRYNELKMAANAKQKELEKLCDQLHGLELENKSLREMQHAKTTSSARIKSLKEECEAIQREMDVKIQYRDQLDHMHSRLQNNTMKFSAHIKKMEDAMFISKREYQEVKLLLRQLEQGKTEAVAELQDTLKSLAQERKSVVKNWRQGSEKLKMPRGWKSGGWRERNKSRNFMLNYAAICRKRKRNV